MLTKQLLLGIGALILITALGCSSAPTTPYPSPSSRDSAVPEKAIGVAKSMLGVRYKYGGESPKAGFDCSGLVYYSYLQVGITLPRTSYGQYSATSPVKRRAIKRGDLLFFRVTRRKISHVGIYLGNNRFIHAPSRGKAVSIDELDSPYWRKRFIRAGRVL